MSHGQITPDSRFGQLLTRLAREANTILEIGTFHGDGSTLCLHRGLVRPSQRLHTLDFNKSAQDDARRLYADDSRVILIHGTIVRPDEFQPFHHPDPASERFYAPERDENAVTPYVYDLLPVQVDLLLIDGGEWTASVEFSKLWERSAVIALDDVNPLRSNKNASNYSRLVAAGWQLEAEGSDRNSWAVFRRPL